MIYFKKINNKFNKYITDKRKENTKKLKVSSHRNRKY